jgi:hypothetical protein
MGTGLAVGEPEHDRDAEESERGEPSVLSEREAMSILTSSGSGAQTSSSDDERDTESRDSG